MLLIDSLWNFSRFLQKKGDGKEPFFCPIWSSESGGAIQIQSNEDID